MKLYSPFSLLALAALVSALPEPKATAAPKLVVRSDYDTGLTYPAGSQIGSKVIISVDPIGDLRSALKAGENVSSIASALAASDFQSEASVLAPYGVLNAQQSSSALDHLHSVYDEIISIAAITDTAEYASAGASYTSGAVSTISTQLAALASAASRYGGGGQADSSVDGTVPAVISLLAAVAASFWMIL